MKTFNDYLEAASNPDVLTYEELNEIKFAVQRIANSIDGDVDNMKNSDIVEIIIDRLRDEIQQRGFTKEIYNKISTKSYDAMKKFITKIWNS